MLTPIDIQNKVLKTGMGYNKKDVDDFIIEIMQNYEALYKENVELKEKIATLSEGIQYYKTIETTLQKALVLAEKTSKETRDAAILKAEALEKDARVKANIIIADAKNDLETIRTQTINLIQNYESFRTQFKKLAETQMELMESESFQIYAPDLDALLSGTAEPITISDSMEEFYPEGDSPIVTSAVQESQTSPSLQQMEAEAAKGQEMYQQAMQQAETAGVEVEPPKPQQAEAVTTQSQQQVEVGAMQPQQAGSYETKIVQSTAVEPPPMQPEAPTVQPASPSIEPVQPETPKVNFMSTADLTSELEELQSYGNTPRPREVSPQLKQIAEPLVEPVEPQMNYGESTAPAPNQMTEVMENPYVSQETRQEGQELDQQIGHLYADLGERQETQTASEASTSTPSSPNEEENMFEFFSTED